MIDAMKDYLAPKRFGAVSYVCLIVHFLCGLILIPVTLALRASETGKFSCAVDKKSTAVYRTYVEKTCYSRYEHTYNSPLPLYGFVLLSIGLTVLVSVIYSLAVGSRVDEIADRAENGSEEPRTDGEGTRKGFYVFYRYFFHLVARSVFGIVFTALQHTVFYPNGFDFKFSCSLPTTDGTSQTAKNSSAAQFSFTLITCENSTASEKELWGIVVSILNTVFALIVLGEVTYLCRRSPIFNRRSEFGWNRDIEFVTDYLLPKRYTPVDVELAMEDNNTPPQSHGTPPQSHGTPPQSHGTPPQSHSTPPQSRSTPPQSHSTPPQSHSTPPQSHSTPPQSHSNPPQSHSTPPQSHSTPPQSHSTRSDRSGEDSSIGDSRLAEILKFYKQHVLDRSLTSDICYAQEKDLDDIYIDVIIHTGRAQHKFSKKMKRHEMYDVYMKVPSDSIRLEKIKDLFYPNKDKKGKSPRTILAVGRPGIGKTVLTEKVMRDWANGIDEFYHGKIAFCVKFRWFSYEVLKNVSLKTFLRYGTGLSDEKFESIFQEIVSKRMKGIFIFDGLDEFNGDVVKCVDESRIHPNDPNTPMSPMTLFIKLVSGKMFPKATILVTSRPTADVFYSKLHFDLSVEIIGFTPEKIEEYVSRFCDNENVSDLKPKIWNHIKSSSDLLYLCYIPVNCLIVCVTLSGCLINSNKNTAALPTTMTTLYQMAVEHFGEYYNRNLDEIASEQMMKKLQELAFDGMKNRKLVFNKKRLDAQMRTSGLVNCFTNPDSPLQTQFCFIHLTIQEFLAAKHVIETLAPDEIEKFISTHFEDGKWHLVLQFIAGLLGEKIKMSGSDYPDCVLAFAKGLSLRDGEIDLNNDGHVFVMKCLREVDDDDMVKKVCEKTPLNHAKVILVDDFAQFTSSGFAAVNFVCKHLNNIKAIVFFFHVSRDNYGLELCKLLQKRCLETLYLVAIPICDVHKTLEQVMKAYFNSTCTLDHEHSKLLNLGISGGMTGVDSSLVCSFIKTGKASHLQVLDLHSNEITSCGMAQLCEVLTDELCGELVHLDFSHNAIRDEGLDMLCKALKRGLSKINTLVLKACDLTAKCMCLLSEVLCDEHCKLTCLILGRNDIRDEGVRVLCEGFLKKEHCKLTRLGLHSCSLTTDSVRCLSEVLRDEHCKLTDLELGYDNIGNEGVLVLCEGVLRGEQCKLTELELLDCNLTDQCVPLLCETLKDRNCRLIRLDLILNSFTEKGKRLLRKVMEEEICKARGLKIFIGM